MFTGIVEEVGKVASIRPSSLTVSTSKDFKGYEIGGSIAVNGVCLTVTGFNNGSFTVDIMDETIRRSNIGLLSMGDKVNLERPLSLGGPLGGHLVQGHVDATGKITSIRPDGEARIVKIEAPPEVMRYVVEKGFIAVDGMSLTVIDRNELSFRLSIVEHTWNNTNLSYRKEGAIINLEVDIIAKYVEQLGKSNGTGITTGFLAEHGFV
jgi:riboflavin synthase